MYKSYGLLRALVIFAGIIGILQSLLWIAISILAILSYHCVFNFRGIHASLATLTELTLFQMYFRGTCPQSGMPNIDYASIAGLNLIRPIQIHFCMWIYCSVSTLWLISSITIITSVRYANLKNANYFLNIWILLTFALSIMDLCLGIAFGIDYDTLRHESHRIALNEYGGTDRPQYTIFSAKSVASIMMAVIFRGYTVWVMNVVLCIYFFTQTFKITDYNRIKKTISNTSFVSSNGTMTKKPLPHQNSFGEKSDQWIESLHTYGYQMSPVNNSPIALHRENQAAALFEERKRHYEAQQLNYLRYITRAQGRKSRSATRHGHTSSSPAKKRREISVPAPDYSPNVQRIEAFSTQMPLRSALKTSRY